MAWWYFCLKEKKSEDGWHVSLTTNFRFCCSSFIVCWMDLVPRR